MPTSAEGKTFSNIAATTAAFTLNGGKYVASARTANNWSSFATGTLAFPTVPVDGDTVTLGASVYRFKSTMALTGDVKLEATAAATLLHLVATINGTGVAGVDYFAGTTVPNASATAVISGTNMNVTALVSGSGGNSIATTETLTPVGDVWGGATLSGGGVAGSAKLQILGGDGTTWISISSGTDFTADAVAAAVDLPPSQYRFTIANAGPLFCAVTRVPL